MAYTPRYLAPGYQGVGITDPIEYKGGVYCLHSRIQTA